MAQVRRSKAEQAAGTRGSLVGKARELFASRGYAGVSLDEVIAGQAVTKGALYHHFGDKRGLFRAVVVDAQAELAAAVIAAGKGEADPWAALEAACLAFFDTLQRPGLMRLICAEAGQVLDYADWNALDEAYGMAALRRFLDPLLAAGTLRGFEPEALARLLSGAIYYGVDWAASGEPARFERIEHDFLLLLRALRRP